MSDVTETNDQAIPDDALGMSDEAFASMDLSAFEQTDDATVEDDTQRPDGEDDVDTADETNDPGSDDEDADAEAEADDAEAEADDAVDDESAEDGEDSEAEDPEEDEETDSEVDYKAEYSRLMAPFKANGKEMKVDSVDDAIQLMQMGANYNKKMAALKPSLKTLKTLEKHGLVGSEKLNHLIDVTKGDKGAIQKLLKDSGVDPLDLDTNEESDYEPNTYTVDDREMALDEVLESIQDTPTFSETMNVVSTKWDGKSQDVVANNPQLLEVINGHMASGIYERVSSAVEKERTFGRLKGLSDIEAYKQVGDRLNEQGAFNDLVPREPQSEARSAGAKVISRKKPAKPDPKVKQKKRAASSTKAKPAGTSSTELNPLSMSDEEFEKQVNENFL